MSKVDDLTRLKHIRDAAQEALSFTNNRTRNDLDTDRMLSLALVRLVEIIGEAGNRISEDCQVKYSKIPWRQIVGMRNRIIHAYFDIDLDIVECPSISGCISQGQTKEEAIENIKDAIVACLQVRAELGLSVM
ncbi:MAG: DUF86 domain-containing protein [Scytonematopsis contorta HA4267-MV1]|jgi:uncharacterized protein with HEPN domain|nr:DUF86 domain-containing protein [Scytonematopsis contorta HA4267-MV1]